MTNQDLQVQTELPLNDSKQRLQHKILNTHIGSNSSWYITYSPRLKSLMLMIRTHDLGGTDYDNVCKVSLEDAQWLLNQTFKDYFGRKFFVYQFMNAIKTYNEANNAN